MIGYRCKDKRPDGGWGHLKPSRWGQCKPSRSANDHFLDIIAARGDRVLLATAKKEIRPGSPLAHEIQYLTREKGYRWVNQWSLRPR